MDAIEKLEKLLPFYRIEIDVMFKKIRQAEKKFCCGSVTCSDLRDALPSPAWEPLESNFTTFSKLILSDAFKMHM
eukprot:CAMPEP_0170475880 /NCGR_PEP_ID=MMETSP0123-20130129/17460_1 /TAXON_ID=182087 /ORGANISM="Favella ehrenbergii, Strain Fehren 1" /LENGTH=74 /DNA_ID=CAMNT_0010746691 /DNA_START=20 /DNA_END=244 /DNA_ORIENTATION=+